MKKLLVLAISAMILACGSVSASALNSPSLDADSVGGSSNNNNTTVNGNTSAGKAPSTGVSTTYAVCAALAALTCGGVAVIAKKRISE